MGLGESDQLNGSLMRGCTLGTWSKGSRDRWATYQRAAPLPDDVDDAADGRHLGREGRWNTKTSTAYTGMHACEGGEKRYL